MKRVTIACLLLMMMAQAVSAQLAHNKYYKPIRVEKRWQKFNPGEVTFRDESPLSEGSGIYHRIITNPISYIQENARRVLQTLYWSPSDPNLPKLQRIIYTLKDYDGVSEKYGSGDHVGIRYSTRWIERSFAGGDTMRLDYETRGVLYHELTMPISWSPRTAVRMAMGESSGASSRGWPMLCDWLAAASNKTSRAKTAPRPTPGERAIVWLVTSCGGFSRRRTRTSCASSTARQPNWTPGRGMLP